MAVDQPNSLRICRRYGPLPEPSGHSWEGALADLGLPLPQCSLGLGLSLPLMPAPAKYQAPYSQRLPWSQITPLSSEWTCPWS